MSATSCAVRAYTHYHVEFYNFDGRWTIRRFDGPNGFDNAKRFYDKCGQADLLGCVKYSGKWFLASK